MKLQTRSVLVAKNAETVAQKEDHIEAKPQSRDIIEFSGFNRTGQSIWNACVARRSVSTSVNSAHRC